MMIRLFIGLFRFVGRSVIGLFAHAGHFILLVRDVVKTVPQIFRNPRLTLEQMVEVGIHSLPIVFIVSVFAGATTAWQAKYQLEGLVPVETIGTAVSKSIILELGPVLTALVVAGRIGSSVAAELATMRVTEQIDALYTMSIDPIRYLVLPRVTAGIVMLPVLVVLSYLFGITGGYVTAVFAGHISGYKFIEGVHLFFYVRDVAVGLFKAYLFGAVVAFMGCYFGYIAEGGAQGVGTAAIKSFVSSSLLILMADFFVAIFAFA